MKEPVIPSNANESVLDDERRRHDEEFRRRGRAAINHSVETGVPIPAEEVIAKLQAKIDAARQRRG